ncbi:universal stress protein [Flavihumibacter fluvii]|uniref:universal stress protein n=1 Tax=Flavihumibacter fluvii TaxID=2838157 RepID=UPI001BDF2A42|nr:universal stress protein [Flavihumibacter fluvii]ULQ51535.1 universal stress protein [Flavihumibacter fluvii]
MANILVPFDFSANATAALDQAILLADQNSISIEVLHITNAEVVHDYPVGWKSDPAHKTVGFIQHRLDDAIQQRQSVLCGDRSIDITGLVKESAMINGGVINQMLLTHADLIIMGTHGATNALDRFWGSNTATMINHALFPILAIPRNWNAAVFTELIAAVSLKEIGKCIGDILKWSQWMKASPELVCISSIPEIDQVSLDQAMAAHPEIKAHLVPKKDDLPMWRNLVQFTATYHNALLLMFVHERTVLEKLFNYSITSKVADGIKIPLLALPTGHK